MGNIPACAGKTGVSPERLTPMGEHPRVRGENIDKTPGQTPQKGTSPRARGKRSQWSQTPGGGRNIPACAGKTELLLITAHGIEEHPRVRGENLLRSLWHRHDWGTSPRARGKRFSFSCTVLYYGNIPACAGKTLELACWVLFYWEHPRVRGENSPN